MGMLTDYIMPVAAVICAVACYVAKTAIASERFDRFVPLVSALLGLAVVLWACGGPTPEGVAQGLVSGLAATGMYELVKNFVRLAGEGRYYIDDEDLKGE